MSTISGFPINEHLAVLVEAVEGYTRTEPRLSDTVLAEPITNLLSLISTNVNAVLGAVKETSLDELNTPGLPNLIGALASVEVDPKDLEAFKMALKDLVSRVYRIFKELKTPEIEEGVKIEKLIELKMMLLKIQEGLQINVRVNLRKIALREDHTPLPTTLAELKEELDTRVAAAISELDALKCDSELEFLKFQFEGDPTEALTMHECAREIFLRIAADLRSFKDDHKELLKGLKDLEILGGRKKIVIKIVNETKNEPEGTDQLGYTLPGQARPNMFAINAYCIKDNLKALLENLLRVEVLASAFGSSAMQGIPMKVSRRGGGSQMIRVYFVVSNDSFAHVVIYSDREDDQIPLAERAPLNNNTLGMRSRLYLGDSPLDDEPLLDGRAGAVRKKLCRRLLARGSRGASLKAQSAFFYDLLARYLEPYRYLPSWKLRYAEVREVADALLLRTGTPAASGDGEPGGSDT